MELPALLKSGATVVVAIGAIGGSAWTLDNEHDTLRAEAVPHSEFEQHLSEQRVRTIFSYLDQIEKNGPVSYLCRALEEEFLNLCSELPDHPLCQDRNLIIDDAGC